jgi:hypothetical protein
MPMPSKHARTLLLSLVLLPACASLHRGPGAGQRAVLWRDAHNAFYADSFRVATVAFQTLATQYSGTPEGREARFYLAALHLDPRNTAAFDPHASETDLAAYLAQDSLNQGLIGHRPEATSMLRLAREVQRPCEERVGPLRCETRVVERRVPGQTGGTAPNGASAATVERLQAMIADRDEQIQRLNAELNRIRATLVPRRP